MKILIPARKNSKGIPFKNRKLFDYTANIIPDSYKQYTYVFSDDSVVNSYAKEYGFNITQRNENSAKDQSTTKDMITDFCSNFDSSDFIVMLYLTYPNRKWEDVERAIKNFQQKELSSLLCRKEVKQTPYLMMFDAGNGKGKQVVQHNFSRRQDYRECFEISHYISIFSPLALDNLNNNLYNEHTYFMQINEALDVDTEEDMKCILKS